jgi:hypothetical protein
MNLFLKCPFNYESHNHNHDAKVQQFFNFAMILPYFFLFFLQIIEGMTEYGMIAKYYLIFLLSAYEIFLCVKELLKKKLKKIRRKQHFILKRFTFASEIKSISKKGLIGIDGKAYRLV